MNRKTCLVWLLAALFIATTGFTGGEEAASKARPSKSPDFERLKTLVGDWVQIDEEGNPTDNVVSTIRLTAGGNALLEVLFGGTDHEMVTVYHQDGEDLVLTHYCVVGHHPKMKAEKSPGADRIVFKCQGAHNMTSEDQKHMHQGTIQFKGKDRFKTEWLMHENGKVVYTASYDLVRKNTPRG